MPAMAKGTKSNISAPLVPLKMRTLGVPLAAPAMMSTTPSPVMSPTATFTPPV